MGCSMRLTRKLKSFGRLRWADRAIIAEAAVLLALARICVLTVPFRILVKWLDRVPDAPASDPVLVARVGRSVAAAARNVPWNAVCLPQAIAAKAMLARRGQGSAFHLGATIEDGGKFSAHAWLECDGRIVIGAAGIHGMSHLLRLG
jgi:hypothetical protein